MYSKEHPNRTSTYEKLSKQILKHFRAMGLVKQLPRRQLSGQKQLGPKSRCFWAARDGQVKWVFCSFPKWASGPIRHFFSVCGSYNLKWSCWPCQIFTWHVWFQIGKLVHISVPLSWLQTLTHSNQDGPLPITSRVGKYHLSFYNSTYRGCNPTWTLIW